MIIVYCRKCGTALRPNDFERDKARMVAGSPYCRPCDPIDELHLMPGRPRRRRRALGRIPT